MLQSNTVLHKALLRGATTFQVGSIMGYPGQLVYMLSGRCHGCSPREASKLGDWSSLVPRAARADGGLACMECSTGSGQMRRFSTAPAQQLSKFAWVKVGSRNAVKVAGLTEDFDIADALRHIYHYLKADGVNMGDLSALTLSYLEPLPEESSIPPDAKAVTSRKRQFIAKGLDEPEDLLSDALAAAGWPGGDLWLHITSPASAASLREAFEQLTKQYYKVGAPPEIHRDFLTGLEKPLPAAAATGHDVSAPLGSWLPFQNRHEQCKELVKMFINLDTYRGQVWDDAKRKLELPICYGMPGIGKTRFARAAVPSLERIVRRECREELGDDPPLDAVAAAMVQHVFVGADEEPSKARNELPQRVGLMKQLMSACEHGRNLRVDCSLLVMDFENEAAAGVDPRGVVACAMLAEWAKYWPRMPDYTHLDREFVQQRVYAGLKAAARSMGIGGDELLIEAAQIIAGDAEHGSDDSPVILLSLDEAQRVTSPLINFFPHFFVPLVVQRIRLFPIASGVRLWENVPKPEYIDKTNAKPCNVVLPMLKQEHVMAIFESFRPKGCSEQVTQHMRHAAWWAGGVPRHIEFMLWNVLQSEQCQDLLSAASSRNDPAVIKPLIWRTMQDLNARNWRKVLNALKEVIITGKIKHSVQRCPTRVVNMVRALAISEQPVELNTRVANSEGYRTVDDLQAQHLCYWKAVCPGSVYGHVRTPPVIMADWERQTAFAPHSDAPLLGLEPPGVLSSTSKECLAMAVLMDRLQVREQLSEPIGGNRQLSLSQLLGLQPLVDVSPETSLQFLESRTQHLGDPVPAPRTGAGEGTRVRVWQIARSTSIVPFTGCPRDAAQAREWEASRVQLLDTMLTVPKSLGYRTLRIKVENDKLPKFVRAELASDGGYGGSDEVVAFLNGAEASCADAIIVFKDQLVVFIQEKQRIPARQKRLSGKGLVPPVPKSGDGIRGEYNKVQRAYKPSNDLPPFVFLYITDERSDAQPHVNLPHNCFVFDHSWHRVLLGEVVSEMRKQSLAADAARNAYGET